MSSQEAMVFGGDVLEILEEIEDDCFGAVFCDPPYGLSDKGSHDVMHGRLDVLSDFVFPDFQKAYPEIAKDFDLSGVTLDGSPLCRRQIRAVVEAGIAHWQKEIENDDEG